MNEPTVEILKDGAIILVNCPVADCYYAYRWRATAIGSPHEVENALLGFRVNHLPQHEPGRTRDVILETTVSGHCSNCRRSFSWSPVDGDRIWCTRCGASWDEYGTDGRTDSNHKACRYANCTCAPLGELAHLVVHPDGSMNLVVHPWGEDDETPKEPLGGTPNLSRGASEEHKIRYFGSESKGYSWECSCGDSSMKRGLLIGGPWMYASDRTEEAHEHLRAVGLPVPRYRS